MACIEDKCIALCGYCMLPCLYSPTRGEKYVSSCKICNEHHGILLEKLIVTHLISFVTVLH
jgi:hypothetical protein